MARAVTDIGGACWVLFTIYFASYYPSNSIGRAIGIINFVQGAAIVVATLAGGIIADIWDSRINFFIAALSGTLSLVVLSFASEPITKRGKTYQMSTFYRQGSVLRYIIRS